MVYCGPPSKGCETCRKRKIRCDQRPLPDGCTQCSKAKRKCPGYRDLQQVMFRNESAKVEKRVRTNKAKQKASPARASDTTTPEGQLLTPSSSQPATPFPDSLSGDDSIDGYEDFYATDDWVPAATALVATGRHAARDPMAFCGDTRQMYALTPSADDRAASFFFTHNCSYVFFTNGSTSGFSGIAGDPWPCEIDEHLYTSMKAIGSYGIFRHSRNPEFHKLAWSRYADAVRQTNKALQSPSTAVKDSTLLAVIILGIFESNSGYTRESLTAWENHVNGAAALISMRGKEQLKTAVGRRMLTQITSTLLITCISRDIKFPDSIAELMEEAAKGFVDPKSPAWRLREIMIEVANFRAMWRGEHAPDPAITLAKAQALDNEIVSMISNMPPAWRYRTIYTTEDPDIIMNGYYHVYPGYWLAQTWNSLMTCRLLLNAMMRHALLAGFGACPPRFTDLKYAAMFQSATETLYAVQADVIASVPQHIGYISSVRRRRSQQAQAQAAPTPTPKPNSTATTTTTNGNHTSNNNNAGAAGQSSNSLSRLPLPEYPWSDFNMDLLNPKGWRVASAHLPIVRSYGSMLLLWSLFLVGNQDVTTEATKRWVIKMLRHLGNTSGMQQANLLAGLLAEQMGGGRGSWVEAADGAGEGKGAPV